jgi:hypothetical protein
VTASLADFQAITTEPGDLDDYDVIDQLRCRRCGAHLRTHADPTLADLIHQARAHHCLKDRP